MMLSERPQTTSSGQRSGNGEFALDTCEFVRPSTAAIDGAWNPCRSAASQLAPWSFKSHSLQASTSHGNLIEDPLMMRSMSSTNLLVSRLGKSYDPEQWRASKPHYRQKISKNGIERVLDKRRSTIIKIISDQEFKLNAWASQGNPPWARLRTDLNQVPSPSNVLSPETTVRGFSTFPRGISSRAVSNALEHDAGLVSRPNSAACDVDANMNVAHRKYPFTREDNMSPIERDLENCSRRNMSRKANVSIAQLLKSGWTKVS